MPSRHPAHRETEIKLRIPDLAALIDQLRGLHASCSGRILERNTLFDTPDSDIRRRGCLLRLRIETPARSRLVPVGRRRALLTSKSPAPASAPAGYKCNLESESPVAPAQNWLTAFRALGFRPGFRYEKFRTSFHLRGARLDLDETPVGVFLEIEGTPSEIDRIARSLGFWPRDYIRATYWDLYAAECRRRGQIPRNMLFRG
jgi:adenylate cyclase, class 2